MNALRKLPSSCHRINAVSLTLGLRPKRWDGLRRFFYKNLFLFDYAYKASKITLDALRLPSCLYDVWCGPYGCVPFLLRPRASFQEWNQKPGGIQRSMAASTGQHNTLVPIFHRINPGTLAYIKAHETFEHWPRIESQWGGICSKCPKCLHGESLRVKIEHRKPGAVLVQIGCMRPHPA